MNDLFRYFRPEHGAHSKTNACLCALLSYYIYPKAGPTKNTIPGSRSFSTRFRSLVRALSDSDPFDVEFVNGSDAEAPVLVNSRVAIVVFRGTELSVGEWVGGSSASILFNQLSSRTRRGTANPPWLTKDDAGRALPILPG